MKTKTVYQLSPIEERIMRDFLNSLISSRDVAKQLGISHQQVINMATSLTRLWIADGNLGWEQPINDPSL